MNQSNLTVVIQSRLLQYFLSDPISDGGQWDSPHFGWQIWRNSEKRFPGTYQSSNPSRPELYFHGKLRKCALEIRRLKQAWKEH